MSTGGDYGTAGKLDFELPSLPQENNVLAHLATQWIEQAEAILAGRGMLNVAKGGMPPAAERIIDTPISAIPGGLTRRDDQARLNLIADNQRNQLRREELLLSSWTSLYVALLSAAEKTAPLHCEALRAACKMGERNPQWDQYFDGPRAWKMTLCLLRGKTRTKRDKQFYRSALELQLKSHMANGASADEYSKRARAFIIGQPRHQVLSPHSSENDVASCHSYCCITHE